MADSEKSDLQEGGFSDPPTYKSESVALATVRHTTEVGPSMPALGMREIRNPYTGVPVGDSQFTNAWAFRLHGPGDPAAEEAAVRYLGGRSGVRVARTRDRSDRLALLAVSFLIVLAGAVIWYSVARGGTRAPSATVGSLD